jgi:hypothetical protein
MPGPARAQVSGHAEVSASDCQYPCLSASSGTRRARDLRRFLVAPSLAPDRRQRDALVLAAISRPASGNRPSHVLSQAPPPNPIAAEPYGRRFLSRGGAADHE